MGVFAVKKKVDGGGGSMYGPAIDVDFLPFSVSSARVVFLASSQEVLTLYIVSPAAQ